MNDGKQSRPNPAPLQVNWHAQILSMPGSEPFAELPI